MPESRMKDQWSKDLNRLRGPGLRRAQLRRPSASLAVLLDALPKGSTIVDLGCGDSGDSVIARERGFRAYGMDLFRPKRKRPSFIQGDAAALPLMSESVDGVISHAMVALLSPVDRWAMYREVARVLKPQGLLAVAFYPLTNGHPVTTAMESIRIYESGLHRKRAGLYVKCSDAECAEHLDPDSWQAILRGILQIDNSPDFVETASAFVAWVVSGGSIKEASEFAGISKDKIQKVIKGATDCGIFNPNEGSLSLPWLDYYIKDDTSSGNVSLVLDVLAIRGEVERINGDDGLKYGAKQQAAKAEPKGGLSLVKTTQAA